MTGYGWNRQRNFNRSPALGGTALIVFYTLYTLLALLRSGSYTYFETAIAAYWRRDSGNDGVVPFSVKRMNVAGDEFQQPVLRALRLRSDSKFNPLSVVLEPMSLTSSS